jgi:hypothetical protein
MEPLEQSVEGLAPDLIGNVSPKAALQRVRLEQPPVEKRHCAKVRRCFTPLNRRPVQRTEEQRTQQITVDSSLATETPIHLLCQKALPAAEPSLGLHEVEEEDAGELQEREAVSIVWAHRAGQAGGHPFEGRAKLAEEAVACGFARQRLGGSGCVGE